MAESRTGPKFGHPTFNCNICSSFTQRTPQSCLNHSQERCEWVDVDLGILWVESEQILPYLRVKVPSPAPQYLIDSSPIPFVTSHMDLGVLVDSALKFNEHISKTANKSAALAHNVLKSTACRSPEFMMPIYSSHIRPIMEYCSCLWHTGYVGDTQILESVQRLWTKQVIGLKDMDYGARLRALKQYSVRGRLLRADMIYYWKVFHGKCALAPGDLFKQAEYQGTRGHRYKIELPRTRTDVRKRSFAVRGIATWNQLPDNVVATRDLSSFKKRLAECLGDALYRFHQ